MKTLNECKKLFLENIDDPRYQFITDNIIRSQAIEKIKGAGDLGEFYKNKLAPIIANGHSLDGFVKYLKKAEKFRDNDKFFKSLSRCLFNSVKFSSTLAELHAAEMLVGIKNYEDIAFNVPDGGHYDLVSNGQSIFISVKTIFDIAPIFSQIQHEKNYYSMVYGDVLKNMLVDIDVSFGGHNYDLQHTIDIAKAVFSNLMNMEYGEKRSIVLDEKNNISFQKKIIDSNDIVIMYGGSGDFISKEKFLSDFKWLFERIEQRIIDHKRTLGNGKGKFHKDNFHLAICCNLDGTKKILWEDQIQEKIKKLEQENKDIVLKIII